MREAKEPKIPLLHMIPTFKNDVELQKLLHAELLKLLFNTDSNVFSKTSVTAHFYAPSVHVV